MKGNQPMGNYNKYQLTIHSGFGDADLHKNQIAKCNGWESRHMWGMDEKGYGNHFDSFLKRHSEKYPEIIFCLTIIGEGPLSKWKIYYGKGKSQVCKEKRYFPKFDRSKLSEEYQEIL